jgi:Fe-Mn family superoxide dismutase
MIETFTFKPRTWNLSGLTGVSDKTLETHFALYEGYVKNTNLLREEIAQIRGRGKPTGLDPQFAELERRLGFEYNGMRLHELFFDNLTTQRTEMTSGGGIEYNIRHAWGTVEAWRSEFVAMSEMRGVGWVLLCQDPWSGDFSNHWVELHQDGNVAGYIPILVMDVWEHAFMFDYKPAERARYAEAFLSNVDWNVCEERIRAAFPEGVKVLP